MPRLQGVSGLGPMGRYGRRSKHVDKRRGVQHDGDRIGTQLAYSRTLYQVTYEESEYMPRLEGQSSNTGMLIITLLVLALLAFALLEYFGTIDLLAFFGR